jgi:hypothetical protein
MEDGELPIAWCGLFSQEIEGEQIEFLKSRVFPEYADDPNAVANYKRFMRIFEGPLSGWSVTSQ